jgi:hypothetical protein
MASATLYYIKKATDAWADPATLGIQDVKLTYRATGHDELTWSIKGDGLATAWAYNAVIRFKQRSIPNTTTYDPDVSGTYTDRCLFVGHLVSIPRQMLTQTEAIQHRALGAWYNLEKCTYLQSWALMRTTDNALVTVGKPRVVLGQDDAGLPLTTGEQIAAILDHAIAVGKPIATGTIDTGVQMPYDERDNLTCADAIHAVLRWHPDWVLWADYDYFDATEGDYLPKLHCRASASLSAATIAVQDADVATLAITPRHDINLPGITIHYEITHTYNGTPYRSYAADTAGTPSDPAAITVQFSLEGRNVTYLDQPLTVADYVIDAVDQTELQTWWEQWHPWLADVAADDVIGISGVTRSGAEAYPSYVTTGTIQDWMEVDWEEETITALITYYRRDDNGILEKVTDKPISITLISCNGTSKTYRRTSTYRSAETVPSGIAAALYASWNKLHYDGALQLHETEPTWQAMPGNVINLTGGLTEWATMAAIVQDVTVDVDRGLTFIQLGSSRRLGASDLLALFKAARNRRFSLSRPFRTDAAEPGAASIPGAAAAPVKNAAADAGLVYPSNPSVKTTLGAASEGAETADTTTWTSGAANENGLEIYVFSRVGYFTSGDNKLYGYARKLIFDRSGRLHSVSAETRVEIDACTQVTMLTAWRLDKPNHYFQVKTRTGYLHNASEESTWTNISDSDGGLLAEGLAPSS